MRKTSAAVDAEYVDQKYAEFKKGNTAAKYDLLKHFAPVIKFHTAKNSNVLPKSVVESKLKQYTLRAIETYDPKAGASLRTHVQNYMQKINRDNYNHMQAVRLPENVMIQYSRFKEAEEDLSDRYGRTPTLEELGEELGISSKAAGQLRSKYHSEYVEGRQLADIATQENDVAHSVLSFAYHSMLSPEEKFILESKTGYNSAPMLSSPEIQKKLKMTQYQFYTTYNTLRDKLAEAYQAYS